MKSVYVADDNLNKQQKQPKAYKQINYITIGLCSGLGLGKHRWGSE